MFERFSEGSRALIYPAQALAQEMGHDKISSGHILLAMFDNKVAGDLDFGRLILRHFGIDPDVTKEKLLNTLGRNRQPKYGRLRLSSETERMFATANKIRGELEHSHVNQIHLILAALLDDRCLAGQLLRSQYLNSEEAFQYADRLSESFADKLKTYQVAQMRR